MKHSLFRLYLGMTTRTGKPVPLERLGEFLTLAQRALPGFSVYGASGYWQGTSEPTQVLEFVAMDAEQSAGIYRLARDWNRLANQESTLVVHFSADAEMIQTRAH